MVESLNRNLRETERVRVICPLLISLVGGETNDQMRARESINQLVIIIISLRKSKKSESDG